jgi:hypothetical protein
MEKDWILTLKSIDKCRETAYKAKSEWFQEYWHGVADSLEQKVSAQPYDGKLN